MPIQSQAQWKLFAVKHPDLLHKWQKESPVTYSSLPKYKNKSKTLAESMKKAQS